MKKIIGTKLFILLLILTGCANIKPINTSSGNPDITIPNVSKKKVTDEFVNKMLTQGFNIKSTSDYDIVFVKPRNSIAKSSLLGSHYYITSGHRVSANIVESGTGVRIVLTIKGKTNPGSLFERDASLSKGNPGSSWQQFLVSFADNFRGRIGCEIDEQGIITNVVDNSPSQQYGLKPGDKVISVDGNPFRDRLQAISQITGDPDTSVDIIILRNNKKLTFKIIRKIYPFK